MATHSAKLHSYVYIAIAIDRISSPNINAVNLERGIDRKSIRQYTCSSGSETVRK